MMPRVLEPEVMDTDQDAQEYDAMDFRESNQRFAQDALSLITSLASPRVLDVGTGTAQIPLHMLEMHPSVSLVALDMSRAMLHVAQSHLNHRGLSHRCKLVLGDGKALPFSTGEFDLVMCNSTIHHAPDPFVLLHEIIRVVRPGGAILVRDLFRPASTDEAWATVRRVSPNDSERQQQLFFDSLCAALTLDEVRALAARCNLTNARIDIISDRHWTLERAAS